MTGKSRGIGRESGEKSDIHNIVDERFLGNARRSLRAGERG
jgi:hypothetical protein